jgi:hypothetical protein
MSPPKKSRPKQVPAPATSDYLSSQERRYRIAIHEVGHAVVLRHFGYAVDEIIIHDEGGECLSTQFDAARERGGAKVGRQIVAVALAGRSALEEFFGNDEEHWMSCITDAGTLNYGLEEMGGSVEDCNIISKEVREIIRAHKDEVEREARVLASKPAVRPYE